MQVIKRVRSNYQSILRAKLYFLVKKSLWLYLFGILLIASVLPLPGFNMLASGVIYCLVFVLLVLVPLYHFSSVRLARLINFDADVEFSESNIVIRHLNKPLVETKDWNWIAQINITGKSVLLTVNQLQRFLIILDKNKLTADELHFFEEIKRSKFESR